MSTREDRQKNNCPSRGLGLAAAAIGVGVGAALYYLFSKRPEHPDEEGSTSGWTSEQPQAFSNNYYGESSSMEHESESSSDSDTESSYTTVSENTTSDTSINDSESSSESDYDSCSDSDKSNSYIHHLTSRLFSHSDSELEIDLTNMSLPSINIERDMVRTDSVGTEWDVTDSSIDVPEENRSLSPMQQFLGSLGTFFSPRVSRRRRGRKAEQERLNMLRAQTLSEEEQINFLRAQAFRERSWSLEECSICFEIMLKDQRLTSLPCAHNFHEACIAPWLNEQQTCPNCRKAAE